MFLVERKRPGTSDLVFTWQDPREDGFTGSVVEGVTLDYDMNQIHTWPDGHERPEAVAGQDPSNAKHYKVFKYTRDLQAAGFRPVSGVVSVFGSWAEYTRLAGE